jgi:hypothetical protein
MRATESIRQQMFTCIIEWQQSGITQKAWCRQHNMPYHVFHYWYKCYCDEKGARAGNAFSSSTIRADFAQLQVSSASSSPVVELLLNNGKRLVFQQLVSRDYLKSLID